MNALKPYRTKLSNNSTLRLSLEFGILLAKIYSENRFSQGQDMIQLHSYKNQISFYVPGQHIFRGGLRFEERKKND